MQTTVTAFLYKDKVAIRIPKVFGIKPGDIIRVRKQIEGFVLRVVDAKPSSV